MGSEARLQPANLETPPPTITAEERLLAPEIREAPPQDQYFGPKELVDLDFLDGLALAEDEKPLVTARTPSNNWVGFLNIGFGGGNSQFTHAKNNDTKGGTQADF